MALVEVNMLDTDKVLSRRSLLRDSELEAVLIVRVPASFLVSLATL